MGPLPCTREKNSRGQYVVPPPPTPFVHVHPSSETSRKISLGQTARVLQPLNLYTGYSFCLELPCLCRSSGGGGVPCLRCLPCFASISLERPSVTPRTKTAPFQLTVPLHVLTRCSPTLLLTLSPPSVTVGEEAPSLLSLDLDVSTLRAFVRLHASRLCVFYACRPGLQNVF